MFILKKLHVSNYEKNNSTFNNFIFFFFSIFSQNKKTLEIISEKMCQYAKNETQSQGDYFTKLNTCITNLINIDIPVHYPKFSSKGQDFQMIF